MSFAIPTEEEGTIIQGNLSIQPKDGSNQASIEVLNTIFTDKLNEYNPGFGLHILNTQNVTGNTSASVVFYGGTKFQKEVSINSWIDIKGSIPSNPDPTFSRVFFNTVGNVLQTLDTNGKISTLNPLTSKGDIPVHNGTTETRLPIGTNGQVLVVDTASSSGLKWGDAVINGTSNSSKGGAKTLFGTQLTMVKDVLYGSELNTVVNEVSGGPCGNFFTSKRSSDISAAKVSVTNSPGVGSLELLNLEWFANEEIELSKNGPNYDGNYSSEFYNSTFLPVSLSGVSWIEIFPELVGVFVIKVSNDISGPVANFLACKNVATQNNGSIIRISQSPSSAGARLRIRWQSNSGIELRKTESDSDGSYNYTNLVSLETNITTLKTLTGTTPVEISKKHQRLSSIIAVYSNVTNSPCAIFSISKNDRNTSANIARLVSSPGVSTLETLRLLWNANSSLQMYKDGNGYNGEYIIVFLN
jgi:hypothetical protein